MINMPAEFTSNLGGIVFDEVWGWIKQDCLIQRAAKSSDDKLMKAIRMQNDMYTADKIDSIFTGRGNFFLGNILNPERELPKNVQNNILRKIRRQYYTYCISDKLLLKYIQQSRANIYKLLSPEFRIMGSFIDEINSLTVEGLDNQQIILRKLDELLSHYKQLLKQRHTEPAPRPKSALILRNPNQYLTHKLTLSEDVSYTFTLKGFGEALRALISAEPHPYILADGGVGKTTFLQNVQDTYVGGPVYLVNLIELKYPEDLDCVPLSPNYEDSSAIFQQIRLSRAVQYQSFLRDLNSEHTLLLLDGFNEVPTIIKDFFFSELEKLLQYPCKIILTGREKPDFTNEFGMTEFTTLKLSADSQQIRDLQEKIGKERNPYLYNLITAPMYFYILKNLTDKTEIDFSKYTSKFCVMDELFKHTYRHGIKQLHNSREKKLYWAAIWLILPWLAYQLSLENKPWPSDTTLRYDIDNYLEIIRDPTFTKRDFVRECQLITCQSTDCEGLYQILSQGGESELKRMLDSFVGLIQANTDIQNGMHQDIRDYAAAIYFQKRLELLKAGFTAKFPESRLERETIYVLDSLDSSTIDAILWAVLQPKDETMPSYHVAYTSYYSDAKIPTVSMQSYARFLMWYEAALQLSETLVKRPSSLKDEMSVAYCDVTSAFYRRVRKDSVVEMPLTLEDRIRLEKVLLKAAELLRNRNDFNTAISVTEIVEKNIPKINDPEKQKRSAVRVRHHINKILLCQRQVHAEEYGEPLTDERIRLALGEINALDYLATQDSFIYSATTLGRLYSYPPPFFLRLGIEPDYPKAFWYYYSVVFGEHAYPNSKQITANTIRDCAFLLLFGLVHVTKDLKPDQPLNRNWIVSGTPGQPKETDIAFIERLFGKLQHVRIRMRHVLAGLTAMYRQNRCQALEQFASDPEEHLVWVAVYRMLKNEEITSEQAIEYGFEEATLHKKITDKIQMLKNNLEKPCKLDAIYAKYLLDQMCWIDSYWEDIISSAMPINS